MDSMKSFHFIPNAIGNWRRTEPIQRRDSAPTGARIKTRWGGGGGSKWRRRCAHNLRLRLETMCVNTSNADRMKPSNEEISTDPWNKSPQ